MPFAIKAEISDTTAERLVFPNCKTMYGGKHVLAGDEVFLFASENEGGLGLFAQGIVNAAEAVPRQLELARQTPRVSIAVQRTSLARQRLGRNELKAWGDWADGRPETELNFKLYRQATNKLVGLSAAAAGLLATYF